jgi:quercetin dioxygenase-like cupin family protein
MAAIIVKGQEPSLRSETPGRERTMLVTKERCNSTYLKADTVTYQPNAQGGEHFHNCESFIFIIDGECEATVNGKPQRVEKSTMIYLAPGDKHYLRNTGSKEMVMLEAFAPQANSIPIFTNPNAPNGFIRVDTKT